ncbi:hypothetical protein Ancab_017054, partial [Ancistrocladus abbreviatus]
TYKITVKVANRRTPDQKLKPVAVPVAVGVRPTYAEVVSNKGNKKTDAQEKKEEGWPARKGFSFQVKAEDIEGLKSNFVRILHNVMQTVNGETPVAPQISTGNYEDHNAAFGGGGIKTRQRKLHSSSRLTGDVQLRISEKETEVAEIGDRELYGRGMAGATAKRGSTSDNPLDEKAAEEQQAGEPEGISGNQSKGGVLPTWDKGKHTMGYGEIQDRAECSKAHIAQEESDGLDTCLATLLRKKKGACRDSGQQNTTPAGSHKKKKGVPILMGRF